MTRSCLINRISAVKQKSMMEVTTLLAGAGMAR